MVETETKVNLTERLRLNKTGEVLGNAGKNVGNAAVTTTKVTASSTLGVARISLGIPLYASKFAIEEGTNLVTGTIGTAYGISKRAVESFGSAIADGAKGTSLEKLTTGYSNNVAKHTDKWLTAVEDALRDANNYVRNAVKTGYEGTVKLLGTGANGLKALPAKTRDLIRRDSSDSKPVAEPQGPALSPKEQAAQEAKDIYNNANAKLEDIANQVNGFGDVAVKELKDLGVNNIPELYAAARVELKHNTAVVSDEVSEKVRAYLSTTQMSKLEDKKNKNKASKNLEIVKNYEANQTSE